MKQLKKSLHTDFHLSRIATILKNGFNYKLWAARDKQENKSCVNNQRVMGMIDDNKKS